MAPRHATGYHRVQGPGVTGHPGCDAGKVAGRGAQHTNMFSLGGEGERCSVHADGQHVLPVLSRVVTFRLEKEELGLLRNIHHASGRSKGL